MSMREVSIGMFAVTAVAGCSGVELDVGSNEGGTEGADAGSPSAAGPSGTGASDDAASNAATDAAAGSPRPTIEIATCVDELPDASATLGVGFSAFTPAECAEALGPPHSVASSADLMGLLSGTWYACAGQVFGMPVDSAKGVALTSDGQYHLLGTDPDDSLVSLGSLPSFDAGSSVVAGFGPAVDGTYDVLDGSATYGPGTYELQLHPANGGLFEGQVLVTDSPRALQYFQPNETAQTLSPAVSWSFRAGVCSCMDVRETKFAEKDARELGVVMTGRWLWCGNGPAAPGLPSFNSGWLKGPLQGIEFTSDNTWYALQEDSTGALSRETGVDHGSFQVVSSSGRPLSLEGVFEPEPLTVVLATTNPNIADGAWGPTYYAQSIMPQDVQTLLLTTVTAAGTITSADYSIFFRIP